MPTKDKQSCFYKESTVVNRVYIAFFSLLRWVVLKAPSWMLRPMLNALANLARWVDAKHRRIIRINLDLAYGESMDTQQKEKIVRECYKNMVYLVADFMRNYKTTQEAILQKVRIENENIVVDALASGRPVIFQTAHYGNWELVPLTLAARFGPLSGVGRPLDNPAINQIVRESREQFDVELIDKKGAMRAMLKAVKNGRNLGLLVDQNTSKKAGVVVEFFGRPVRHTPAASILARRIDGVIVPVFITTQNHETYTLSFYDPIEVPKTDNMEEDILAATQAQAHITEAVIRQKPEEWFWFHRRWRGENKTAYGVSRKKNDA
ncbi:MAG: lipid A biosynthesis acyltransferase [Campylobacterales bacterium]|nr:lipid A biosynthesis acyltransferase [Campylobacterales bacterium]